MGKTKTAFIGTEEVKPHSAKASRGKEKPFGQAQGKPAKIHIAGLKGGQRIRTVEADLPAEALAKAGPETHSAEAPQAKKPNVPKVRGKKYLEAKAKVNPANLYTLSEAIKLLKGTSTSKFDGSAELHIVVKKAGTSVNVTLPHAGGKKKKVEVASEATIKKLAEGKIDFDVLVATPEMMPKLVPFARILGPRGLMPNPKNGTLVKDPKKFSGNSLNIKTEREAPLVHTVFGKVSQDAKELKDNLEEILRALGAGKQIVKAYVKATMGPSIKIKL